MTGLEHHWDTAYRDRGVQGVSWYQDQAEVSLALIAALDLPHDTPVLDVGGGASVLVDGLLAEGWSDVSVLDLSGAALAEAAARNGPGTPVHWLHEDLLGWTPERGYGLWHDRAVLHFLVDEPDRQMYRQVMRQALRGGGAFVIGCFAADGPEQCSGLPVRRYDPGDLEAFLGEGCTVRHQRREDHRTPGGAVQHFTWVAGTFGAGATA